MDDDQKPNGEQLPQKGNENPGAAKALRVTSQGVDTARKYATAMSYLMDDLLSGKVTPDIGNAVCNAGGKMMRAVEMQHKYGEQGEDGHRDVSLNLMPDE